MKQTTNILLIITCVFTGYGFIGKSLHLPGSSVGLILGYFLAAIGFLMYLILRFQNKEKAKTSTYIIYFYLFTMTIGSNFMVGNTSKDLLNAFVLIEQGINQNNEQIIKNSELLLKSEKAAEINHLTLKTFELINKYKKELVEQTGGVDFNGIPIGKDNQDYSGIYFIIMENGKNGKDLKNSIQSLQESYVSAIGKKSSLINKFNFDGMPDPDDPTVIASWISMQVERLPLSSVVTNLTVLQNKILNNNLTVLNYLAK